MHHRVQLKTGKAAVPFLRENIQVTILDVIGNYLGNGVL